MMKALWLAVCVVILLAGCATPYQNRGAAGGYIDTQVEKDIWRVKFGGNGYTTYETVQTYWLYRCAELVLEQKYDGFEILSDVKFVKSVPMESIGLEGEYPYPLLAMAIVIPIAIKVPKPVINAEIRLIKKPFEHAPPKIFDAVFLKQQLEKYVAVEKDEYGNVLPHDHYYIRPLQR